MKTKKGEVKLGDTITFSLKTLLELSFDDGGCDFNRLVGLVAFVIRHHAMLGYEIKSQSGDHKLMLNFAFTGKKKRITGKDATKKAVKVAFGSYP